jgi:3'(2'), 5'-bisphosphate nucleotidase
MTHPHSAPSAPADEASTLESAIVTGTLTLAAMARLAVEAGEAIMFYYRQKVEVVSKSDSSPVTRADIEASEIILAGLEKLAAGVFAVSEEHIPAGGAPENGEYFLIDPLDGTRSFIRGSGKFTVNIGYLRGNRPHAGVIYDPQTGLLYAGMAGLGAFRQSRGQSREGAWKRIETRALPVEGATVAISHHIISPKMSGFLERLRQQLRVKEARPLASSLKFCLLAEGTADIYARFGPTMEWDTAAGHALTLAAGGEVYEAANTPLRYGKENWQNQAFIAVSREIKEHGLPLF